MHPGIARARLQRVHRRRARHAAAAAFCALLARAAAATTAGDLGQWCAESADDFRYGMCVGFINGALSGIETEQENARAEIPAGVAYRPRARICIPKEQVTNGQLRQLVIRCVAADPNHGRTDGADIVYACIRAAYPCAPPGPP